MKISIILSVFNEEKHVDQCLNSLSRQKTKNLEIIVVDDGSRDRTPQIINELSKQIIFKYYRQKHQGPAIARSFAAKKAKGEILVFLDADMSFPENFIAQLVAPLIKKESKGTYSINEYVANWENVWARCWNYNWNLPDKKRINPKNNYQSKDFRAILRQEFEKVAGFDNTGYTDTWTLSEKLGYLPTPTKAIYYHYNPEHLKEVFKQAIWVAKRPYKLGVMGKFIAIVRAMLPFSIINGLSGALKNKEPQFLIFKIIYDFGVLSSFVV